MKRYKSTQLTGSTISNFTVGLLFFFVAVFLAGALGGLLGAGFASTPQGRTIPTSQNIITAVHQQSVPQVVEQAAEAVVSIAAQALEANMVEGQASETSVIGSGFVIDANGVVITSAHVVNNPTQRYFVITKNQTVYPILTMKRDDQDDVAVLTIAASNLPVVRLGNSDLIKPGQEVIAIGSPFSLEGTVTAGVISGLNRSIVTGNPNGEATQRLNNLIQIDAAINPGNSGGPLLDSSGEVIGIAAAGNQMAQSIGFAVPVNTVKKSLTQFSVDKSSEKI